MRKLIQWGVMMAGTIAAIGITAFLYTHQPDPELKYSPELDSIESSLASMNSVGLPERRQLVALVKKAQFDRLNRILARLQARYESGEIDEYVVAMAFGAFSRADPALAHPLKRWRKHSPHAFAPFLASGIYDVHIAWSIRGSEWRRYTSDPQIDAMQEYLEEGGNMLWAAAQMCPRLPVAWSGLIGIAMATRPGPANRIRLTIRSVLANRFGLLARNGRPVSLLYQQALRHVPRSPSVHRAYHRALEPKWGGDAEEQATLRAALRERFEGDARFDWVLTYEKEREIEDFLERDVPWISAIGREAQIAQVIVEREQAKAEDRKNTETALRIIDALLAERKTAWLYKHRGMALRSLERFEEAVDAYEQAINLAPAWSSLYEGMIRTQGRMHRVKEVHRYWKQVLEIDPYGPDLLLGYAEFLGGILKQTDKANAVIRKALVYGRHDDELRIAIAKHYWEKQTPDKALEETSRAVELVPGRAMNWFYHGLAFERMEDCKAIEAYRRFQDLCTAGWCRSQRDRVHRTVQGLIGRCR